MISETFKKLSLSTAIALGLMVATGPALAETDAESALAGTIDALETGLEARIGLMIHDTASDWTWSHREDERFLMASVFKSVLCGAVLYQYDRDELALSEPLMISRSDYQAYAPVTKEHVGSTLTIGELCLATLDMSDNTAANLLIDRVGGPAEVTAFLRSIGDPVTRLDRMEPHVNIFTAGDPRDTTSPAAIVATWQALLLDDALTPQSRAQLADWMRHGSVTGNLLRASTPQDWIVVDKSGGGRDHTRNIVAMVTLPERSPFLIAIFVSDTPANWTTRNEAVAEVAAAVVEVLKTR